MPFPRIDPLIETFLEPTRIFLFGKRFPTLTYTPEPMAQAPQVNGVVEEVDGVALEPEFEPYAEPADGQAAGNAPANLPMPPGLVEQALREAEGDGIFARIYGFSFEGHYYKLPRPLLFLVRGPGNDGAANRRFTNPERTVEGVREFNTRFTGLEGKDWWFGNDIRVWAVDKHDIAVCLDLEIGSYDQVLLQPLAPGQEGSTFRGPAARSAGAARGSAELFRGYIGPHQD